MNLKSLGGMLIALSVVVLPGRAVASFHLVKVVEVFAGSTADPTAQYVMLQMYLRGQTFVSDHSITVFDVDGASLGTFTFSNSLSNGANLATILIATQSAEELFGIAADLTMTSAIQAGGGAVCWDSIDCVAWGNASTSGLPVPPATTAEAAGGLTPDLALHRMLSSGGAVTPLVLAPPAPKNNAGQVGGLPMPSPTAVPTATPTPVNAAPCVGDCNGESQVTVDELLSMVNVALGTASVSACRLGDANQDGEITVEEILAAVNNALNGCPTG